MAAQNTINTFALGYGRTAYCTEYKTCLPAPLKLTFVSSLQKKACRQCDVARQQASQMKQMKYIPVGGVCYLGRSQASCFSLVSSEPAAIALYLRERYESAINVLI